MKLDRVFADISLDDLPVLLFAVAKRFDRSLTAIDVDRFCADVKGLAADDDMLIEQKVVTDGQELPFAIDVFKDVSGELEAVFLAPTVLSAIVQEEARKLLGSDRLRTMVG